MNVTLVIDWLWGGDACRSLSIGIGTTASPGDPYLCTHPPPGLLFQRCRLRPMCLGDIHLQSLLPRARQ